MVGVKHGVSDLLERLPDDCSIQDIQYHLFVLEKILRGTEDAGRGRTLSHVDVEQRLSRWRKTA